VLLNNLQQGDHLDLYKKQIWQNEWSFLELVNNTQLLVFGLDLQSNIDSITSQMVLNNYQEYHAWNG